MRTWIAVAALLAFAAGCGGGQGSTPPLNTGRAAAGTVTEFRLPAGHTAGSITAGGDGNVWFAEPTGIGRISVTGDVAEFPVAQSGRFVGDVVEGPDGSIWFDEYGSSDGCLDHFTAGAVTRSCNQMAVGGGAMVLGPDGNFWLSNLVLDSLIRIAPSGVFTRFPDRFPTDTIITVIGAGPDGNVWYSGGPDARLGRITPSGTATPGVAALEAVGLTAGPDGNVWATERNANAIARVTPAGNVTTFSTGLTPGAVPSSIIAGPDGNLWFTEWAAGRIGRITPAGIITEFSSGITAGAHPNAITIGPDGNVWFSEDNGRIGRLII